MSGHKQAKKDGARKEKSTQARKRDFEQPIVNSTTWDRGDSVSNFTDGDIPGADHTHDERGQVKRPSPVSEPRRRTGKNPE